jgi:hypothetical protein
LTPGGPEPIQFAVAPLFTSGLDGGPVVSGHCGPDPVIDVVAGDDSAATLVLFAGDGSGGLRRSDELTFPFASGFRDLVAADVNLDGQLDVIGSLPAADRVAVALGDGQHGLIEGPSVAVADPGVLLVRDMIGDGTPDLIVDTGEDVVILHGRGGGSFDPKPIAGINTGTRSAALAIFDSLGYGTPDVVVALPALNLVRVYRRGTSTGGFVPAVVRSVPQPQSLVLADFNGDGRLDIAVAEQGGIAVFIGTPSGFATEAVRSAGATMRGIRGADLNGDGLADLAGLEQAGLGLRAWIGKGDASFETIGSVRLGRSARDLALADLDGDRLLDAIAPADEELEVGENTTPIEFIVGDVNRDGVVNVEDVAALFAELFDGDGDAAESVGGGLVASDAGADVDGDGRVNAADTVALVARIASR